LRISSLQTRLYHWCSRLRAHRVITVSEHAKKDLVTYLGIPSQRITVIAEAADSHFHHPVSPVDRCRVRESYNLGRPYVFYVGGWERRKNVPFLVRAFASAGLEGVDLVLAGGRPAEEHDLIRLAEDLDVVDCLRLVGRVDDLDLPALYAEAHCFVYPSEYEGFGLQLCEAMAVGCPILAADATSLPEVLGRGGRTFSLQDPRELAGLLQCLSRDADFHSKLAYQARLRNANFSWRQTARATLSVYQKALEGGLNTFRNRTVPSLRMGK
jgi:glycosyltransferase involved in cell wall biosynthesis